MLRVGLTGGLGSGKTTVARLLRELGAAVLEADEVGRRMMQPGEPVYRQIVAHFGPEVVLPNGQLDRKRLAELAFGAGRIRELNKIVHPAVLTEQEQWFKRLFVANPNAVGVVESALIYEVAREASREGLPGLKERLDCVVVVTAPVELRIERYVQRISPKGWDDAIAADARARIAKQIPDAEKVQQADFVLENVDSLNLLKTRVAELYAILRKEGNHRADSAL
jgi:dephospho-CoA kinase